MVSATQETLLRWIPLLPLVTAVVHALMIGLVRRPTPRIVVVGLSCGSVLASFLISCVVFFELAQLPAGQRVMVDNLYTWIITAERGSRRKASSALKAWAPTPAPIQV